MIKLFNDYYENLIKTYLHVELKDSETQGVFLNEIKKCVADNDITFDQKIAILNFLTTGLNNPLEKGEDPLDLSALIGQRYTLLLALYDGYIFESKEEEDLLIRHINAILKADEIRFNAKILLINILFAQLKAGLQIV